MDTRHIMYMENIDLPAQKAAWRNFPFCCQFSARMLSNLYAPYSETYKFTLSSDDGAKLYIDGNLIVDHDMRHSMYGKSNYLALSSGWHQLKVDYFEADPPKQVLKISTQHLILCTAFL